MNVDIPLLSLVTWVPIIGGLWVLFNGGENNAGMARIIALAVAIVTFLISIPLFMGFDAGTHEMQFVERLDWIPAFNISYHMGVDGLSMPLIILTTDPPVGAST